MSSVDEVEEIASLWVARADRGLTSEEAETMNQWLGQSTVHLVAYLRLEAAWELANPLAAFRNAAPPQRISSWTEATYIKLIAAVLVLTVVGSALALYEHGLRTVPAVSVSQQYATGTNQQKTVKLSDGTRIELNTNTNIQAEVTAGGRTVKLERGEVYFEIAHDAKRPFVVLAGNRRITDLGTKFAVLRDGDYVKVVVKEGRVRIDMLGQPSVEPVFASGDGVTILKGEETLSTTKGAREINNDLSWRYGMLVFDRDTLADVAAQFNRYNNKQIVVKGAARQIRIGGRFRSDNVESFKLLLENAFNLKVNESDSQIVISKN
jgi:transmembrane sensor